MESLFIGSLREIERILNDAVFNRSYAEVQELSDISVEKYVTDKTDDEGVRTWSVNRPRSPRSWGCMDPPRSPSAAPIEYWVSSLRAHAAT
jgi:hypothetical protein